MSLDSRSDWPRLSFGRLEKWKSHSGADITIRHSSSPTTDRLLRWSSTPHRLAPRPTREFRVPSLGPRFVMARRTWIDRIACSACTILLLIALIIVARTADGAACPANTYNDG
jgi:hypothetical protein